MVSPMESLSVFDIIGPVMVGPSSSHTAGALKIGLSLHRLLDSKPKKIQIAFYNSFADTMDGHGTKKAIVAGVLGFETSDMRIKRSVEIAQEKQISLVFEKKYDSLAHPNSALITVWTEKGSIFAGFGESIGGGSIVFTQLALEEEVHARTASKSHN